MGFKGYQGEHMHVVENTDEVHNIIVWTLCSCYPWAVLGLPPAWYKVVLSRICAAPTARLGHLAFEGQGAFASQC
jgi:nitrile hydratase